MIKLIKFLTTKKSFLLFVLLELIAIILIINSHNYAQVQTYSWQTAFSGQINQRLSGIKYHFYLKQYNDSLLKQNANLLQKFYNNIQIENTGTLPGEYEFIPAYVVSNQYHLSHNIILINKGRLDSIQPEMGVTGTNGVVGIVQKTSGHFSRVISILNKNTKLNVSLLHSNYTGFMQWDGNKPNVFSITDLPADAPIQIGDTIITGGRSSVFPKGIPIGIITDFATVPGQKSYKINLKSFMDYTNIGPVYVIKNILKKEIDSLKTPVE